MSRIVVKIGSNILTDRRGILNQNRIDAIAQDVSAVTDTGHDVVIVSSGAIAAGMKKLNLKEKPRDIRLKQATAAVGQSSLMWAYERSFGTYGKKVGQILLTRGVFSYRETYLNAKNTLLTLLSYGVISIVNENDTIATDEIKFGDNDHLAALVSGLIDAERLVILSDVEGFYASDPKTNPDARIITRVEEITPEMESAAGGTGSVYGTGGMYSKMLAAKKALSYGIRVNIISGRKRGLLPSLLQGAAHGTEFVPKLRRLSSRKGWIAHAIRPSGSLIIDRGAVCALMKSGKSLLPSGITMVEGIFDLGDAVYCVDPYGNRVAKGIVNYSSQDIDRIKGRQTSEVEEILGYKYSDEVVNRDNLVILRKDIV